MPFLEINLWAGLDKKNKEVLISKITDTVVEVVDCPKEAVHIIIREVPKDNWADTGI